jgi:hypothetical protein
MTLTPGIYKADAAKGLDGKLTLYANTGEGFLFYIGGAFTTTANSEIELIGIGSIYWVVTGAITLGAFSTAVGTMESTGGAITTGGSSKCDRLLSITGAVTVGAKATTDNIYAFGALTVGADAVTGKISATGAITVGADAVTGRISATGAITLGAGAVFLDCTGTGCPPVYFELGTAFVAGSVLVPGVYSAPAALDLTGTIYLDGTYVDNPHWTFLVGAAFTTAANSEVVFVGGAGTVVWVVTGAITLGASSNLVGNMQSTAGAITTGDSSLCGDLEATVGAITVGASATTGTLKAGAAITIGDGAKFDGVPSAGGACTGCTVV